MATRDHIWVLVLAAGEGQRVRQLTHDRRGQPAPKQYSLIDGQGTLLDFALGRAMRIAPPERIVPIVAAQHRQWWETALDTIPSHNVIVQPENRGTAAGILLPLLWIRHHDEVATVVVLPSDHVVDSEETLINSIDDAVRAVDQSNAPVILLGVEPTDVEDGYGWIVPCLHCDRFPCHVEFFREKPKADEADSLMRRGALLNSFIMVGGVQGFLGLYRQVLPQLWRPFEQLVTRQVDSSWVDSGLADFYHSIPCCDFSKDVLESAVDELWVSPVPPCGWSDLGTPERLEAHLRHRGTLDQKYSMAEGAAGCI